MGNQNARTIAKLFVVIVLFLAIVCSFGCGKSNPEDKFVGEYIGVNNTYLRISSDGTCSYAEEDDSSSKTGTWFYEQADGLISFNINEVKYALFADVSQFSDGFLLESQNTHWDSEYFTKKQ